MKITFNKIKIKKMTKEDNTQKLNKKYKRRGANKKYYMYKFTQKLKNIFKNLKASTASYYSLLVAMVILRWSKFKYNFKSI